MPEIVFIVGHALLLLLIYAFVWRAVRAVWRDVAVASHAAAAPRATRSRRSGGGGKKKERTLPRELVVHGPQGAPRVVRLDSHDVTFGRAPASTVTLDDPYTSDHHARVFLRDGEWCVADLGSTNGTFLNQVKVTSPTPIAAGDQLGIGKTTVQVRK